MRVLLGAAAVSMTLASALAAPATAASAGSDPGIRQEPASEIRLPSARAGSTYDRPLIVQGGEPPYAFVLVCGVLPPGVELRPDGRLEGTPAVSGAFTFRVEASDASGRAIRSDYRLEVLSPR
ncbi:MAG: Ig domain-containing protein [Caulobacteraceae bacterium]|nr:Ig domain-containing protein [Caulobacteraceae bacterium]